MSAATRPGLLPLAAAATTVVLWASAFVGIRAVGHHLSPGALALGRMLVGALTLTAILTVVRARRRSPGPPLPRGRLLAAVVIWGAAWFGVYNLALNAAERHLDAGTTALLVNVAPVVVAVLAGLLLGEGFPARLLAGMGVAFAGVALIAAASSASAARRPEGAEMLAITKSRSLIVGVTPLGSSTSEMWITAPKFLPVRSTVM